MKTTFALSLFALCAAAGVTIHADGLGTVVVTASNTTNNQLLVYDNAGALVQSVPTLGQGGVGGNAGGVAARNGTVAVVNFGSQTVTLFSNGASGFERREIISTISTPVSVAFGKDHLYVLGTTTIESHRIGAEGIDANADGTVALWVADGSAAQVGVVGDQLIVTEKSGTIETITLQNGAPVGTPVSVELPADTHDTPFGLVTRGASAYVTIAHSDVVGLIKNTTLIAVAATGSNFPNGPGQQAPCWIALVGPYLFTTNSPSHSISRLVAGGEFLILDNPVAAQTVGAPIDIAAGGDLLAVVESDAGGVSHLTQFRVDEGGNLTKTASSAISSSANGVAIVPQR
jgi:hypothetical protein